LENTVTYLDALGFAAGILTTFSAAPQLHHSYTTRDVRGINLKFQIMLISGLLLWGLYGVFLRSLPIVIFNFIGVSLWLPIFWMKLKERKTPS
jgi:MtN3 and saliva related transmembrane protein